MMIKLTITRIGVPKTIQTSRGQAEKNYLKCEEYGDKFLNFWVNNLTRNWKEGQTIEVDNVEERDYTANDGTLKKSYDIKIANKEDRVIKLLEEIASRQVIQGMTLQSIVKELQHKPKDEVDYPEEEPGEPSFDLPTDLPDVHEDH